MNDGVKIKVDMREFNQALREYTQASRRDFAYILNKQMGNIAARASSFAPVGNRNDIKNLQKRDWWPKFIQKVLSQRGGFSMTRRVKAKGALADVIWTDQATGQLRRGRKTMGIKYNYGGGMDQFGKRMKKADYRRISKAIIKRRLSTWKAMRAAFGVAALKFGVPLGKFERPKRLFALHHQLAAPEKLTSGFILPFSNNKDPWPPSKFGRRPTPSEDVAGKERIGAVALQRAVNFVAQDMRKWAQDQMRKTAARFSGRGKRAA